MARFKRNGFVSIDHGQRYSFGSAYYGIYTRDLPVLVTTDSILHAWHRSYDKVLSELETQTLTFVLQDVLSRTHAALKERTPSEADKDIDLYVTIARNLLAGLGNSEDKGASKVKPIDSAFGQEDMVNAILHKVSSGQIETPQTGTSTTIYGGKRYVDWSQFQPRGHYTKTIELKRYFRTMMWLGRADCGFNVMPPDGTWGIEVNADRELRAATNLSLLLRQTKAHAALAAMDELLAFFVGASDNLSAKHLLPMLDASSIASSNDAQGEAFKSLRAAIALNPRGNQGIRSQVLLSDPASTHNVLPPALFQLFGQRFTIDSFILSQVMFDSIVFQGKKQERFMPDGLDVMAALGDDEAVRLLRTELRRWNYSANLHAARDFIANIESNDWNSNIYNGWLGSLRLLDDRPTRGAFPEAMQTTAWQRKQLQTQLASWAELCHDTILYAKQSYTAFAGCEYPTGYVEPYPAFFAAMRQVSDTSATGLRTFGHRLEHQAPGGKPQRALERYAVFFQRFSTTMARLETLARKELASERFTQDDVAFLKKTIDIRGGGSGPPSYDGWYPTLFFSEYDAASWDPTIADIHTDPNGGKVREVAVGDVNFLMMAIDNDGERRVYVGPVYSYYAFDQPASKRLTDEAWQDAIRTRRTPPRPAWTNVFRTAARTRNLD